MPVIRWLSDETQPWLGFRRDVVISAIGAILSFSLLAWLAIDDTPPDWLLPAGKLLWLSWTLLPPLYFQWEWSSFKGTATQFEYMKYNHELCAKFWLAGVGVISAVLLARTGNTLHLC